jgi:uncharacterized membrane protein
MSFIQEYLIQPLYEDTFNPVNTLVYAVLFLLLIFLTSRIFEKLRITFDSRFYSYFLCFIFLGALLGAVKDLHLGTSLLLSTPGIYFSIFILLLGGVAAGKLLEHALRMPYNVFPIATALSAMVLLILKYPPPSVSLGPLLHAALLGILPSLGILAVVRGFRPGFLDGKVNFGVLLAHMLDAASTYLGVTRYGLEEKFFLTGYLMQNLTPAAIFPIKAALVLAVLYILDREQDAYKDAIKAALLVLGLAPGLRNTFLSMFL